MVSVSEQAAQWMARWDSFFQDVAQDLVIDAALEYPETKSIVVPFNQIQLRDPELADHLLQKPTQTLRAGANAAYQIDVPVDPKPRLHLRVDGLPESVRKLPRDLRSEHLGKFLALEGLVKKVTEVRPMMLEAVFLCRVCGNMLTLLQEEDTILEPGPCECTKQSWKILEEESRFVDYQKVEIQENPEGLRGGAQPERLTIHFRDDLVHTVAPGDRIRINGILETQARRQGQLKRTEFDKVLNAVSVELQQQQFDEIKLTEEDELKIVELSRDPNLVERFRMSFAPTIHGLEMEKDALILSLFGGVAKHHRGGSRNRGDIHILMVGDPGVAKSQLLRFLSKLAPRAIFTSGKSASAAGLTAAAVKDEFGEGQWTLEAGALVLADNGVACIDELDKMSTQDQSSMHQAMEQQEISIAKAGVSATLKSRCAVVGAANPKLGRFDQYAPIHGQINMPPALLSRFDLIFSLLDKPSREGDDRLASFLLKTHKAGQVHEHRKAYPLGAYTNEDESHLMQNIEPDLDADFFRKYVAYAKRNVVPVMSDDALDAIREYYVNLRNQSESIPFTARQLEAFVRLSEASAKMRLSQEATIEDANRAISIVEHYLRSVGVDRETGEFDIDVIQTGVSHSQHDRLRMVRELVKELAGSSGQGYVMEEDLLDEAVARGMEKAKVEKALEELRRNNSIFCPHGHGTYAPL